MLPVGMKNIVDLQGSGIWATGAWSVSKRPTTSFKAMCDERITSGMYTA